MIDFSEYDLQIVIVDRDKLLCSILLDNFIFAKEPNLLLLSDSPNLDQFDKIDILITNDWSSNIPLPEYRIKNVINISNQVICTKEISLLKPYKLYDLAKIITNFATNNKLFIPLYDGWIFNESEEKLQNKDLIIRLTEKENKIVNHLARQQNKSCSKDNLFKSVWKYSPNSETTTMETHLYKLRNKLPEGMLNIDGNMCILN